jgi:hypothetical protein
MKRKKAQLKQIENEVKEVTNLIDELNNNEGWTLVKEVDDIKTFYRHEPSTPVHSIKMQGIIDCPALNIMAVMNEHSLYHKWIPLINEVCLIKQLSNYRKVIYLNANLPWPLAPRDAVMYGYGVDYLEEETIVVMIRSCVEDDLPPQDAHLIPPPENFTRVDTKFAGVLLRPLSETSTYVTMMSNTDPKFTYIPYALLNWATKQLSFTMWSTLVERAKTIGMEGNEYEKLMQDKPELYANIQQKLDVYFSEKRKSEQEKSTNGKTKS